MATEKDYMDFKNNSDEGRLIVDRIQQMMGPKSSGGTLRASILQLPSLVDRPTAESIAVLYGVFATSDEDPILILKDKVEHTGRFSAVPVPAVATPDAVTAASIGLSADEMQELATLRAEKMQREQRGRDRVASMNAGKAKAAANA